SALFSVSRRSPISSNLSEFQIPYLYPSQIPACPGSSHIFHDDNKPGDKFFEPIDTPFGKIGLFVCYEVSFPEVARYQRSKGADIIIMPTAWVPGPLK
ncbi:carbon-nitrogen hydrolase family protein, partial [[Clostridium] symbiosum]|uniref:carbon-nitrogen hydrolase family protein n=1 Tax=Clostridium symbiosum TaxID=1512 RepID=UPI00210EE008